MNPSTSQYREILIVAKEAALAGGQAIQKHASRREIAHLKASYNLVCQADLDAEKAITSVISKAYPEHALYCEESRKDSTESERLWVIDPLDGTNNFAHGVPQCATSICYYQSGVPTVGVVYNTLREEWYCAVRGEGAYLNNERVSVSTSETLDTSLVGTGFFYDRGRIMEATISSIRALFGANVHGIRRFGSAALDLCMVGCGQLDAFFEFTLEPWDFAAGALFVTEAGGEISDTNGHRLGLEKSSVLASNTLLHPIMGKLLAPHIPD